MEFDWVTMGYFSIVVYAIDEIEFWHTRQSGSWQPSWLVIGHSDLGAGELLLDTDDPNFRVLCSDFCGSDTETSGPDVWEPAITVATTLDGFLEAFRELKKLSVGRDSAESLKANPVGAEERSEFLARIARICTDSEGAWFWESRLD